MECLSIESCVRGYYIYKEIWKVNVEEQIPCQCEMAAVLITLFRQLSSAVNERYWPCFFGCVSLVLCSSTHARQLNQEDTICGFRHCQ